MAINSSVTQKHFASLRNLDCIVGDDCIEIAVDRVDIALLHPPKTLLDRQKNVELRQRIIDEMKCDCTYSEKQRDWLKTQPPIKLQEYSAPLEHLLASKGLNISKPYRVMCFPHEHYTFHFYQAKMCSDTD